MRSDISCERLSGVVDVVCGSEIRGFVVVAESEVVQVNSQRRA